MTEKEAREACFIYNLIEKKIYRVVQDKIVLIQNYEDEIIQISLYKILNDKDWKAINYEYYIKLLQDGRKNKETS